jgi:hypothetical protein
MAIGSSAERVATRDGTLSVQIGNRDQQVNVPCPAFVRRLASLGRFPVKALVRERILIR